MSVFQLNDWWTVQVSSTEEFDHGSMCVGNVDNAYPAMDKIVVGSLAGMLRIYSPTKPVYRIEDLVIEEDLGAPILQLLMGKFIPSTDSLGLAVLHPRKLSVYEVVPQGNSLVCLILFTPLSILTSRLAIDIHHKTISGAVRTTR